MQSFEARSIDPQTLQEVSSEQGARPGTQGSSSLCVLHLRLL
jgi:hypothetical protein